MGFGEELASLIVRQREKIKRLEVDVPALIAELDRMSSERFAMDGLLRECDERLSLHSDTEARDLCERITFLLNKN